MPTSGRVQRVVVRREAERLEHRAASRPPCPSRCCRVERLGQVRVARRIPLIVVDPVQDADQVAGAVAQDAVEAEPELRRLDLLRRTAG